MGNAAAGTKVRVGADAAKAMAAIADIRGNVAKMARGEENPEAIRKKLVRRYFQGLRTPTEPGRSSVPGHKWAVIYAFVGGVQINFRWEYLPGLGGYHRVLAFCPHCYWIAPTGVRTADATKPVFFNEQLAHVPGSKESDKKFVAFEIRATRPGEIYMDSNDHLTVDRLITCPQVRVCGWTFKLTDGIASNQPRGRSGHVLRASEGVSRTSGSIVMPGGGSEAPIVPGGKVIP